MSYPLTRYSSIITLGIIFIIVLILNSFAVFQISFGIFFQFLFIFLTLFAYYLLLYKYWIYFEKHRWDRKILIITMFWTNIIVQLAGGLDSPNFGLLILFFSLTVIREQIVFGAWLTVIAMILEVLPLLFRDLWQESTISVIKYGFLLMGLYVLNEIVHQEGDLKQEAKEKILEIDDLINTLTTEPIDFRKGANLQLLTEKESRKYHLQQSFNLNRYIEIILGSIQKIMKANTCIVYLKNIKDDSFSLRSAISLTSEKIFPHSKIDINNQVLGWVIKEKRPLIIGNLKDREIALPYYKGFKEDYNIASILASPIFLEGKLEGILVVDSITPSAFKPDDKTTLNKFCEHIALLIDSIRAKSRCFLTSVQFSAVYEVSRSQSVDMEMGDIIKLMSDIAFRIVPCEGLVVSLLSDDGAHGVVSVVKGELYGNHIKEGMRFPLNGGLTGLVIKNGKHLFIPDLKHGDKRITRFKTNEVSHPFLSFLGVPLKAHNDTLGALVLESVQKSAFAEHDLRILMILANLVSSAVVNGQMRNQVNQYAKHDGLTGVLRHSQFQILFQQIFEQSNQNHYPLSLLFIDIDNFEKLNFDMGYAVGDEVLKEIAGLLGDSITKKGELARYKDDCFVILLEKSNRQDTLDLAKRIRRKVMEHPFYVKNKPIKVTVCIGTVTFPVDVKTRLGMIELGLQALDEARLRGTNQIKIFGHKTFGTSDNK